MPWSVLIERAYPDDETRLEELARLLRECATESGGEAPPTGSPPEAPR